MKKYSLLTIILFLLSCKDERKVNPKITTKDSVTAVIPEDIAALINQSSKDSDNIDLKLKIVNSLDSVALYADAIKYLDKLITKDSLNQNYWLMRGKLSNKVKDTAAAIKYFNYAAKIYPTPQTLLELADVLALTKNAKALLVCDDIMKMNPGGNYNDKAYFFKGVYYSRIADKKNADLFFDKCIAQNYHFAEAYLEKGFLCFDAKNYAAALKIFEQLTNVNPANADGYYWQAKCKQAINANAEAIALYKKAYQLDETLVEAKAAMAQLETTNK